MSCEKLGSVLLLNYCSRHRFEFIFHLQKQYLHNQMEIVQHHFQLKKKQPTK